MQQAKQSHLFITGLIFYSLSTLLTMFQPFFWDTILTSTVAQWFYQEGISNGIAPLEWDAGHPTFFQMYLAGVWNIFGQSLAVSHWAMFPFLVLNAWAASRLVQHLLPEGSARWVAFAGILWHPYLLTQSMMVSYDMLHVTFFLLALTAVLENRSWWLVFSIAGLSAISLRAQMAGPGILIPVAWLYRKNIKLWLPATLVWILLTPGWHLYHYSQTGWMLTTPSETWSGQRGIADLKSMAGNIFGIARGFIDYGAVIVTLSGLTGVWVKWKREGFNQAWKAVLFIGLSSLLVLLAALIPFSNPVAHRYFMSFHALIAIPGGYLLAMIIKRKWMYLPLVATLLSGHFWLYPEGRSNGWDVTLAHWTYHQNRADFMASMDSSQEIYSAFPLFCSLQQTDLTFNNQRLKDIQELKTGNAEYLAWSRVCNDIRDIDLKQWATVDQYGTGATAIIVFRRKKGD
jgi:hypothetical protein